MADKYELVDDLAAADGLSWYEVSNWARAPEHRSRHNLAYWHGADWWGGSVPVPTAIATASGPGT